MMMESSQNDPEVKIRATADLGNSDSDERSTEEIQSAKAQEELTEYDAISEMGVSEAEAEASILQMTVLSTVSFLTTRTRFGTATEEDRSNSIRLLNFVHTTQQDGIILGG